MIAYDSDRYDSVEGGYYYKKPRRWLQELVPEHVMQSRLLPTSQLFTNGVKSDRGNWHLKGARNP